MSARRPKPAVGEAVGEQLSGPAQTYVAHGPFPDRAKQVADVIALIEAGSSENAACAEVGINRATFRAAHFGGTTEVDWDPKTREAKLVPYWERRHV